MQTVVILIHLMIVLAMVGLVLIQKSEGGGLGMGSGGGPGGLMSARGAADFLTRTTKWLAVLFVALAIVLAALAVRTTTGGGKIDDTLKRNVAPVTDPLAPARTPATNGAPAPAPVGAPAPAQQAPANPNDPLAGIR